jgi:predicted GTPase
MTQRNSSATSGGVDLWLLAEEESKRSAISVNTSTNVDENDSKAANNNETNENEQDTVVLFVGDQGSGKSSLIQAFLKPNASNKDPKPTVRRILSLC